MVSLLNVLFYTFGAQTEGHSHQWLSISRCCTLLTRFLSLFSRSAKMSRTLRPRKSQPSYAAAFALDDEEPVAGPSRKKNALDDDEASGSDFAPEKEPEVAPVDGDEDDVSAPASDSDEFHEPDDDLPPPQRAVSAPKPRAAAKPRAKAGSGRAKKVATETLMPSLGSGSGIARTSKRQIYVLPTPSVHHRHRAVPLYSRAGRVERLTAKPVLFGPSVTVPTNNFTHSTAVTNRVSKSWGFNVGAGPLWDLVEDRGWYKEAVFTGGEMEIEANRRPVTHRGLRVMPGWQVLSLECDFFFVQSVDFVLTFQLSDATPYLPTDTVTTEEGNLKPPPPVPCSFGPFDNQKRIEIAMFETLENCWASSS
jgi:transcription factor C subunit 6